MLEPGITALLEQHRDWLAAARVGLVSHAAAVDGNGASSAECLLAAGVSLTALCGPEHGYFGASAAGRTVSYRRRHPSFDLPVYSLYGTHKAPSRALLDKVDVFVMDLQDLGARPYTYVSTMRLVMETAASRGKGFIVADRPIPLPCAVDGPLLDPGFSSFVGAIPAPMAYGMTPGETALWLREKLELDLDVHVARLLTAEPHAIPTLDQSLPWIPPSPQIRSSQSAMTYLATVFAEAIPSIDNGRDTALPFQLLGAPWIESRVLCERLSARLGPGLACHPHPFVPAKGPWKGRLVDGVRLTVTDPAAFQPVTSSLHILASLGELYGLRRIWSSRGIQSAFFDRLYGTDRVRVGLTGREPPASIMSDWRGSLQSFRRERDRALLYPR